MGRISWDMANCRFSCKIFHCPILINWCGSQREPEWNEDVFSLSSARWQWLLASRRRVGREKGREGPGASPTNVCRLTLMAAIWPASGNWSGAAPDPILLLLFVKLEFFFSLKCLFSDALTTRASILAISALLFRYGTKYQPPSPIIFVYQSFNTSRLVLQRITCLFSDLNSSITDLSVFHSVFFF